MQAEQKVEREVARRLAVMNSDESKWPLAAQESIARQAKKLEALHGMLAGLQAGFFLQSQSPVRETDNMAGSGFCRICSGGKP